MGLQVCWEEGWGLGVYSERAREVSPPGPWEQRKEWLVSCLEEVYSSPLSMSLWFIQASCQLRKDRYHLNFLCSSVSIKSTKYIEAFDLKIYKLKVQVLGSDGLLHE